MTRAGLISEAFKSENLHFTPERFKQQWQNLPSAPLASPPPHLPEQPAHLLTAPPQRWSPATPQNCRTWTDATVHATKQSIHALRAAWVHIPPPSVCWGVFATEKHQARQPSEGSTNLSVCSSFPACSAHQSKATGALDADGASWSQVHTGSHISPLLRAKIYSLQSSSHKSHTHQPPAFSGSSKDLGNCKRVDVGPEFYGHYFCPKRLVRSLLKKIWMIKVGSLGFNHPNMSV